MKKNIKKAVAISITIVTIVSFCYTAFLWQPWQTKGTITGTLLDKNGYAGDYYPSLFPGDFLIYNDYMNFALVNFSFSGTPVDLQNNNMISFERYNDKYLDLKDGNIYCFHYHVDYEYNELRNETNELVYFDGVERIKSED